MNPFITNRQQQKERHNQYQFNVTVSNEKRYGIHERQSQCRSHGPDLAQHE